MISLQWDDCYSHNCDEMSKYEMFCPTRTEYVSYIALSNFHLDYTRFMLQLQWGYIDFLWDNWYIDNFREMFKLEISVWTTMFWVRASVISYKSSMRWLL